MDIFVKATAGILIALILSIILSKIGRDFSLIITIAVGCMIIGISTVFLKPIITLINQLISIGNLESSMIHILFKATGIGLISQLVSLLCNDAGNSAMGKSLEILATIVIVWLSLPLLSELIKLVENILNEL